MFFVDLLQGLGHLQWSEPKLSQSWQKANILWHVLCFLHMFFSSILYRLYRLLCKCMRSMLWTQWKQECSTCECEYLRENSLPTHVVSFGIFNSQSNWKAECQLQTTRMKDSHSDNMHHVLRDVFDKACHTYPFMKAHRCGWRLTK